MTEKTAADDPTTAGFWKACERRELMIQQCQACGTYQFYPRPICLQCFAPGGPLVRAKGSGVVYALTTIRVPFTPDVTPPYRVAIVELDEGPRMTTNLIGPECSIGDRVRVDWLSRGDVTLPVFTAEGADQ